MRIAMLSWESLHSIRVGGVATHVTGLQIDPEPGSLAWGYCAILADFEHARWMGERGRQAAETACTWDAVAGRNRSTGSWALDRPVYCPRQPFGYRGRDETEASLGQHAGSGCAVV